MIAAEDIKSESKAHRVRPSLKFKKIPIPNYVTTQLKRSIARAEREVKARGEVGARVLCVKISRVVLLALTPN